MTIPTVMKTPTNDGSFDAGHRDDDAPGDI